MVLTQNSARSYLSYSPKFEKLRFTPLFMYSVCSKSRCYNFNDNSTQSLMRTYLTLSLAKTQGSLLSANTQGSVYVRINQRILLNYFIYKQVKMKLTGLARLGQYTNN